MDDENKITTALLAMAKTSNRTDLTYGEKLQLILGEVIQCMGAEKGSIMIHRENHLEVVAATDDELIGIQQRVSEKSPASYVFLNLEPMYVDGAAKSGVPLRNEYPKYTKDAFLIVPLMMGADAIGVLSITEKIGKDCFSQREREVIVAFAGQLISAAENYRMNTALIEKQQHLEQKNQQLNALEKLRNNLFNMLIHDLKGLVSEIMSNIDILSYKVDSDNLEYVKAAQSGCDTLYRMTSDLMDISQLEEGGMPLIQESIDPKTLLGEAISMVHSIARTRGVGIEEKPTDKAETISFYGDRFLLLRVLQNLLMNAIQFSPENEKIYVSYHLDNKRNITFFVSDAGPGIAQKFHKAVFDKFFQVNKKNDGRIYSTGLGLAFCKLAVAAHGGKISVESDGKKGSVFRFTIPEES